MVWCAIKWAALIVYAIVVLPVVFVGACVMDLLSEFRAFARHTFNQWAMEWGSLREHLHTMSQWASEHSGRIQKTSDKAAG